LRGFAVELIDVGRQGVDLDAQRGRGFIDQVDGLVGEKAVADVTVRERSRRDDRRIFNANPMMHLVLFLQAAQDGNGVFDIRLADEDNLEAALKGGIFFDVLAIFVQRSRADSTQFPASQRGLEHVGGVNRAFGSAGADQGVEFVDEKDDLALRVFDFLEDGFEAIFEFAAIFCAGQHGSEIEGNDALVLQRFGHVAGNDALGEALDDRSLADAGFADEHGIIFGAAGKHLDNATDFFIASNDGVELAPASLLSQVAGVFVQCLEFCFWILVGHFLRAADDRERFQNRVIGRAVAGESLLRGMSLLPVRDGQQQVLGGDVFVFEVRGLFEGLLEQLVDFVRERRLGPRRR
jgi:hypothetical protein